MLASLLREVRSLFVLVARTRPEHKAILFYSEQESYFAYFADVIRELTESHGVAVGYLTSDPSDSILSQSSALVRAYYLRWLLPFYLAFCRSRVMVLTLMDLQEFHLRRSIHDVHYVHLFHGMSSTHMACRERAFDHYDALLCVGPHHVREIRRREEVEGLDEKTLLEAGYPRLDRIRQAVSRYRASDRDPPIAERRVNVLIAPSWHVDNLLRTHAILLVSSILSCGCEVTIRPHPETMRRERDLIDPIMKAFGDRVALEESTLTDETIVRTDVLVTDWSGIALEYAFATERPVLYVDLPPKVNNAQYAMLGLEPFEVKMRERIGVVLPVDEIPKIGAVISQLVADRPIWQERIARLRAENVYHFGQSAKICAEYIVARADERNGHE